MTTNQIPTKLSPNDTCIASARLLDQLGAVGRAYYYVRICDQVGSRSDRGSGWATISIEDLAQWAGWSLGSAKQYLYRAKRQGLFWDLFQAAPGVFVVRYKGDRRVCEMMGIPDLGALFRLPSLALKDAKIMATLAQTEAIQRKSITKACIKLPQGSRCKEVLDIFSELQQSAKRRAEQGVDAKGPRYYLCDEDFIMFGASQKTVAESLGRSERTANRRLSGTFKIQLAQHQPDERAMDWKGLALEQTDLGSMRECLRRFNVDGKVYRAGCNVYCIAVELVRQKNKRKKLKNAFQILDRSFQDQQSELPKLA